MTSIIMLADGASVRVRATSTRRVGLTILGREEGELSIRLTLNTTEAVDLSAALADAALQLEHQ